MGKGHYNHIKTKARILGYKKAKMQAQQNVALFCDSAYHTARSGTHMYCNWCKRRVGIRKVTQRTVDYRLKQYPTNARLLGYKKMIATREENIVAHCTPEYHALRAHTHMYCNWCHRKVG